MFDFSRVGWPVPSDIAPLFTRTFEDIASVGDEWTGAERVAIAQVARAGRIADDAGLLPNAAVDAAALIAKAPHTVNESWARGTMSALGDTRYVELIGITAATHAIDTITRMLGCDIQALPEPKSGSAVPAADNPRLKRRSAWVPMDGPPKPRFALSAAAGTQATVSRLVDRLYPSVEKGSNDGPVRGLTREQIEIVALKVSHSNECFW